MADTKKDKISKVAQTERGYLGLRTLAGRILEDDRSVFQWPNNIATFQKMSRDPIISAANNILDIMIAKAPWETEAPTEATDEEKRATEFIEFCRNNMEDTWKSTIEEIGSYRIYGFHVAEKVWKQVNEGEWQGKFKWKYLPPRSQSTIEEWEFDNKNRNLKGVYQNLNNLTNIYGLNLGKTGQIWIPRNKFLLFTYGMRRGNPEGKSPLKDCYHPWKYKTIIEDYEAVSVAKDLGGVPILQIDQNWLEEAQSDPTGTKGQQLAQMQSDLGALHSGESTYLILPLAYDNSGKELTKFQLKGVEGSGKQMSTRDIINGKQLEILMIYLADVLKLGNESHGSFALSENKQTLLSYGIQHHLQLISDVFNNDLIPHTMRVNGWNMPKERMPKIRFKDLDSESLDSVGKFIQRAASVNFMPRTRETVNEMLEKSGFDYRVQEGDIEDLSNVFTANTLYPEIFTDNESRSGDGMEEGLNSGTGSAQGNNSSLNQDNAS